MAIRSVLCKILLMLIFRSFSTTWCTDSHAVTGYSSYTLFNESLSREQLKNRLIVYVMETLNYIEIVRDFCGQEEKWSSEREAELEKLRSINRNQQEENLDAVLKDTLKGLKKLEPFLDAVEKLTLTSCRVFSEKIFLLRGESPESVQSVINAARIVAPILILFKRDAETFFQPLLHNVNILIFHLDDYDKKTKHLCWIMRQSSGYGKIYNKRTQPLVELILDASENDMKQMLDHLNQLSEIRENQDTRLAFLFQEYAQNFTTVFSECHSRMSRYLSDLEKTAVHLDNIMKRASICTVAGSSVRIAGSVLSMAAFILAPATEEVSLVLSATGTSMWVASAITGIVTDEQDENDNRQQKHNANTYLASFEDDMIKIEKYLNKVANSERPLIQPSAADAMTSFHSAGEAIRGTMEMLDASASYAEYKGGEATTSATEIALEDLNTVRIGPQVAQAVYKVAKAKLLMVKKFFRRVSGSANALFIVMDGISIYKARKNLKQGSETEDSKLIRSRAVLWKSELKDWEKMYNSLCIGTKTIKKSRYTLKKPFLPRILEF
ncbi:uncharacterized protein [Garra rufa]|uniref:uncharacterized protein n=1 Tax=Garra rufa TaxID=137080 RepID=UPI003CCEC4B5